MGNNVEPQIPNFSLSPAPEWRVEAIKFIEEWSACKIECTVEEDNIIKIEEILPHVCDKIIGDGNCLFRALSKAVTGSQINHMQLRKAIVNFYAA